MKCRDVEQLLVASGFKLIRDNGKHKVFFKAGIGIITVPRHNEINELTAKSILKAAGLK